ncbi:hypothetical protein T06_15575 [Trichinella sp. T6]|nr:hypothetical protein T06_15575 [Trichinella sp. T6]
MQLALRNSCFRTRSNALLPRGFLDSDEQQRIHANYKKKFDDNQEWLNKISAFICTTAMKVIIHKGLAEEI